MESLNGSPSGRLLPTVRAHETNRELVWEVELPAPDTLSVSLEGRRLTVRIEHRLPEHPAWHPDPDATAV
jgi:HSP20 family molecular chaperone IbpA